MPRLPYREGDVIAVPMDGGHALGVVGIGDHIAGVLDTEHRGVGRRAACGARQRCRQRQEVSGRKAEDGNRGRSRHGQR